MNIRLSSPSSLHFSGNQPARKAGTVKMAQQQPMVDSVRFGDSGSFKPLPQQLADFDRILQTPHKIDEDELFISVAIDRNNENRFMNEIKPALEALEDNAFVDAATDPELKDRVEALSHQVMIEVAKYGEQGAVELALRKGLKAHYESDNLTPDSSPLVQAVCVHTRRGLSNAATIEALLKALHSENQDLKQFPEVKAAYQAAMDTHSWYMAKLIGSYIGKSSFGVELNRLLHQI